MKTVFILLQIYQKCKRTKMAQEKEKQIRIPESIHKELKKIAKDEGKLLERVSQEIFQLGIKAKQLQEIVEAA